MISHIIFIAHFLSHSSGYGFAMPLPVVRRSVSPAYAIWLRRKPTSRPPPRPRKPPNEEDTTKYLRSSEDCSFSGWPEGLTLPLATPPAVFCCSGDYFALGESPRSNNKHKRTRLRICSSKSRIAPDFKLPTIHGTLREMHFY